MRISIGDKIGTFLLCLTAWLLLSLGTLFAANTIIYLGKKIEVFRMLAHFADIKYFVILFLMIYFVPVYKELLMSPNIVYCRIVGKKYEFSGEHRARDWPIQLIYSRTSGTWSGSQTVNEQEIALSQEEIANYVGLYEQKLKA